MHKVQGRVALFTGISLSALAAATPAFAAPTVTPGVCQSNTGPSVGTPTTPALLDITLVGTTGVTDTDHPAVAVVNSCATGWIRQDAHATGVAPAGDVNQVILNDPTGDVHVLASAVDANPAGDATATA